MITALKLCKLKQRIGQYNTIDMRQTIYAKPTQNSISCIIIDIPDLRLILNNIFIKLLESVTGVQSVLVFI